MSQLLQDRIPATLYSRLENWGCGMRLRREQGTSVTGLICDSMSSHAGQGALGKERVYAGPGIDYMDAEYVERVWASLKLHMLSRDDHRRRIIRAHFVIGSHPGATCRALKLRARDYDDVLVSATLDFGDRLIGWGATFDRTEEMRAMA